MDKSSQIQSTSKLKTTISCILAFLLAVSLLIPFNLQSAFAAPTSAEKQAEADEASAALLAAELEMERLGEDYRLAVIAHDEAVAAMGEAQGRIDVAQETISTTQERLGLRANQMYRQGPLSFIDVIFGASSFEAFTASWDLLNNINKENAELIQTNKDARTEAQAAHDEFSAQEIVAAERQAEAEAVKDKAEELVVEQQAILDGLEAEVAALVAAETAARQAAEAAAAAQRTANQNNNSNSNSNSNNGTTNNSTNNNGTNNSNNNNSGYVPPAFGGGSVVAAAYSRIGCAYVYGATGPNSFDCSGLTSWCYQQAGRGWIGRDTGSQYNNASARWAYSSGGAEPGDVIWMPGHVGIYIGGGQYIHAPLPGQTVCVTSWNIQNSTVLRF